MKEFLQYGFIFLCVLPIFSYITDAIGNLNDWLKSYIYLKIQENQTKIEQLSQEEEINTNVIGFQVDRQDEDDDY